MLDDLRDPRVWLCAAVIVAAFVLLRVMVGA